MTALLADAAEPDRISTMLRLFGIAVVVMAPFGYVRIRRILAERRALLGADPSAADAGEGSTNRPASPVPRPDDVATVVAAIDRAGRLLAGGPSSPDGTTAASDRAGHQLEVPRQLTIDGRPAPATMIDALLADAARRSGVRLTWLDDDEASPVAGVRRVEITRTQ